MTTYCKISQVISNAVEDYKVNKLIDKAHSSRRNTQILAKAELKRFYPEVYEVINSNEVTR